MFECAGVCDALIDIWRILFVCPLTVKSFMLLTVLLNTYYVEQLFAWLRYESSLCRKSPPKYV